MDAHSYCLCDDEIMINTLKINFKKLSKRTNLCPKFIELYCDRIDWKIYCRFNTITVDFIEQYERYIDWNELSHKQVSDDILETYSKKINWAKATLHATDDQLVKFQKLIKKNVLLTRKTIPDEIIDLICDKVGWHSIVTLMSPDQIVKYAALKQIHWNYTYTIEDGLQLNHHMYKKIAAEKANIKCYDTKTISIDKLHSLIKYRGEDKIFLQNFKTNESPDFLVNGNKIHLNPNIDDDFIIKYMDILKSIDQLKYFPYHSKKLAESFPGDNTILYLTWQSYSEYDIDCHMEGKPTRLKAFWNIISHFHNLNHRMICKYKEHLNWEYISRYQVLSPETMIEFENKLDWHYVIKKQTDIPPVLLFKYSVMDRIRQKN